MKKLFIVFSFFFCAGWIKAQKTNSIAINGYAAYVFQDRIKFDEFIGYAREGFQYGIGLEYFLQSSRSIEFKYLRQDSRFPLYGPQGNQLNEGNDEGTISYFLLSGSNYFGTSQSKAMPYAGFGLGVGIVDSKGGGSSTKFALDSKLGIRIKTSSNVSLKLQATLQSVIAAIGSDFYETGGGAIIAVPDYATLLQFGLGGSISFTF